jgi:anti-anti-sigma factor
VNVGTTNSGTIATVVEALDIYSVNDLLASLKAALSRPGDLRIDLREATSMHAAALQLLVSAARTARAEGRHFECVGVSSEIGETLRLTGLTCLVLADGELVKGTD